MVDWQWRSPEELLAHYGPDGPVQAVRDWLETMIRGDFAAGWARIDGPYRRQIIAAWVHAYYDFMTNVGPPDELIDDMAADEAAHPLWEPFARTQIKGWRKSEWRPDWAAASQPRPVGPDLEVVVFVRPTGEPMFFTEPTLVEAISYYVRRTDTGWLIAGQPPSAGPDDLNEAL